VTVTGRLKSLFYKTLMFLCLNILLLPAAAATSVQSIVAKIQAESAGLFASHVIVEGPSQLFISIMLQSAFIGKRCTPLFYTPPPPLFLSFSFTSPQAAVFSFSTFLSS
jgi:hypothetical protein